MKITNEFIKLEGDEFKTIFNYLDEEIQYPEHLQALILKEFLKSLGLKPRNDDNDLDSLFNMIPTEVLDETVEVINNLYSIQQKIDYKNIYLPYLIYYLPINTYKVHRLLSDLILRNLLKKDITLLDVGTGPGSVPIGVIEFYKILANEYSSINFSIQLSILDAEKKFLEIAQNLIKEISKDLPRNLSVNIKEVMNIKLDNWFTISGNYDLICISNVLNRFEIKDNFYINNFFETLSDVLNNDGAILAIEPGDKEDCIFFKDLRNEVLEFCNLRLYSPCNYLWGDKKQHSCSCFSTGKVFWKKPLIIEKLNENGLIKNRRDVSFNYMILRKDSNKKYPTIKEANVFTKLKDVYKKENQKINVQGIVRCVMKKPNYLFVSICDGSKAMSDDEHVHIALRLDNKNLKDRYYSVLKHMNLGQKIMGKNLKCERMWKYPKSYILIIEEDSNLEFYY